ncbi:hypothetical protein [Antarctobacter jejuensis]|uniref:hypothetical protein n=1 Tax=Antarctobacter jejuensis TaxID=1439938 RepID=UPI003FCFE135
MDLLKARLKEDPEAPILFSDIMANIGESSRSNFNRIIRRHPQFLAALEDHCVEEVRVHNSRYFDAFQKVAAQFDVDPEATCIAAKKWVKYLSA